MAFGAGLTRGAQLLTHRTIETLRPAEAPYRVPDQRCKGLAVRVAPSSIKTWDLAYRIRGTSKMRRLSLGRTADIGRELLARDVLGRELKMPADAELEELARVLNVWHSDYHRDQTHRLLNQTKKKARDALAALKDSCAILREDTHRHVASATEDAAPEWVLETLARRRTRSAQWRNSSRSLRSSP